MKVYDGIETLPEPFRRSTVAIGVFDGVHRGHQAILRAAADDAKRSNRPALAFTFDRHPAELLAPERAPAYLTTPTQRNNYIAAMGIDALVVARFSRELSELGPDAFLRDILKAQLGAEAIVEGEDFGFGKARAGTVDWLRGVQSQYAFTLHAIPPVSWNGVPVRSTKIRELLKAGEPQAAEALLGHPYLLAGVVVGGQRLGRTLGYPTANLEPSIRQIVPADGIYAVRAFLDDGRTFGGACSLGERPTIEGAGRSIETFLFDFSEDIYGRGMELQFVKRLRGEEKFDSLDALTAQMARDVEEAKEEIDRINGIFRIFRMIRS